MTILVTGDSHGDSESISDLLCIYKNQVDAAVHLGNTPHDLLQFKDEYPHLVFHAIIGNWDSNTDGAHEDLLLKINGKRVALTHGDRYGVKSGTDRIVEYAQRKNADVCLYGHTHIETKFEIGGILFLNPGRSSKKNSANNKINHGLLKISEDGKITSALLQANST